MVEWGLRLRGSGEATRVHHACRQWIGSRIAARRQGAILESLSRRVSAHHESTLGDGWTRPNSAERAGIRLYLDQQSIDTTTPAGKLMFQVCGAFGEFERSMIRQRINAGLKRAVAQGKQLGRPKVDPAIEKRIQAQLRLGKGMRKVARECGVGTGTVQRVRQEMEGPFVGVAA
jgi:DNA invertase Pin-like site-specific DNA recombinase